MGISTKEILNWAERDPQRWRDLVHSHVELPVGTFQISDIAQNQVVLSHTNANQAHDLKFALNKIPSGLKFRKIPVGISERVKPLREVSSTETSEQKKPIPRSPSEHVRYAWTQLKSIESGLLRNVISDRQVEIVFHFSAIENVRNILRNGLISIEELSENDITYKSNDTLRLDAFPDAISCSIGFPNYRMLYKYRVQGDMDAWVLFAIDPKVLWELPCIFCPSNAASNNSTQIPLADRMGVSGLKRMFEPQPRVNHEGDKFIVDRRHTGIPQYFPTDPQAEALVLDQIPPDCIQKMYVTGAPNLENLSGICREIGRKIPIEVSSDFFSYRADHNIWKELK
jgi:hypothetical protein